jgi:hypothetical protein
MLYVTLMKQSASGNCLQTIGGSGWVTETGPIGNRHTGIHEPLGRCTVVSVGVLVITVGLQQGRMR